MFSDIWFLLFSCRRQSRTCRTVTELPALLQIHRFYSSRLNQQRSEKLWKGTNKILVTHTAMGLKGSSFLFLIVVLKLGNHCYVGLGGASAASVVDHKEKFSCNGTLEDCFSSDDEFEGGEFLGHYAAGGRWLLQTGGKISYGGLRRPPVCTTSQYSNCIVQGNNGYNRCKRAPG